MATNVDDGMAEIGKVVLKEEAVLEKFNGEVEGGDLAERITLVDGVLTKHEWYENGEVVETKHYNADGSLVEEGSE